MRKEHSVTFFSSLRVLSYLLSLWPKASPILSSPLKLLTLLWSPLRSLLCFPTAWNPHLLLLGNLINLKLEWIWPITLGQAFPNFLLEMMSPKQWAVVPNISSCIFFFRFFYVITRNWVEFPVLYSRFLLVIQFPYCSLYMLIPNS